MACASLLAVPALAAPPIYRIVFQGSGGTPTTDVVQSTPFQRSDTYTHNTGGSNAVFSRSAFAYPGHVGEDNRIDLVWSSGPSTAPATQARGYAQTDDFLISGPGAWVEGQLHFRARASLSRSGSGQTARINVDARARNGALIGMGDLTWNNSGTFGAGILAGQTSPDLDFPFVLSGLFPVGTPFDVAIQMLAFDYTYGNGWARTDTGSGYYYGLFLEEEGGQVLTLPAGYTLNSANWGVVDNHFQSIVGVGPAPGSEALRLTAHPNPFTATSTVSFVQPQAAHVRLQVFDLGGRLVRTLADESHAAGTQRFQWDGRADDGSVAPTGLYFARVEADGRTASQRIVRMR